MKDFMALLFLVWLGGWYFFFEADVIEFEVFEFVFLLSVGLAFLVFGVWSVVTGEIGFRGHVYRVDEQPVFFFFVLLVYFVCFSLSTFYAFI